MEHGDEERLDVGELDRRHHSLGYFRLLGHSDGWDSSAYGGLVGFPSHAQASLVILRKISVVNILVRFF